VKYLLRRLGQEPTPEPNSHGVGSRPSLELGEQVADVALDGLLREVEPVADLAVRESFGDELQNLDLACGREMLRLRSGGAGGKLSRVGGRITASRDRLETTRMLAITGQDLLTLSCVHVVAIGASRGLL
jgi:hypothetical protein